METKKGKKNKKNKNKKIKIKINRLQLIHNSQIHQ